MKCRNLLRNIGWAAAFVLLFVNVQLPAVAEEGRFENIQVWSEGLRGNLLRDSANRNVTVYLPHEYDEAPEKRFPVVYLLHGYTGKNTLWSGGGYVEDLNIATIANMLIANGDIESMILVAPDCHNAYRGSWYTNSSVTGNWEDFVSKDLINHIDANYRTIPDRRSRGISGHSMGGHGAIKIAMKHPDLYSAVYAMSPAWIVFSESLNPPFAKRLNEAVMAKEKSTFQNLHWRAQAFIALAAAVAPARDCQPFLAEFPVDGNGNRIESVWQKWLQHDLTTMLRTHGDNLNKYTAVALDCGTEEDLLPMNIAFSEALKEAGVEHTFEKFDGTHINRVASQLQERVLPLFSTALQSSQLAPAAAAVQ